MDTLRSPAPGSAPRWLSGRSSEFVGEEFQRAFFRELRRLSVVAVPVITVETVPGAFVDVKDAGGIGLHDILVCRVRNI